VTRLAVQVEGSHISLIGRIDEAAQLEGLAVHLPAGDVTIDAEGVAFVNSVGMRELIRLVRALRAGDRGVVLERVADVLMTQLNLVDEFARSVTIASFHAQYACDVCGAEHAPLVDVGANEKLLGEMKLPSVECPECGGESVLADFAERYASIFRSAP
jgi:anti-anti-sigma regulatory factor